MNAVDPMRGWVESFPEMLEEGWQMPLPSSYALPPGRLLLLGGMGGSGMAGSLAAALMEDQGRIAIAWRDPNLPGWLSREDRFVLATYSGETREARSMLEEALERSVPTRLVASGGTIAARAMGAGVPSFLVPKGLAPRASLPWLLTGVLRAVDRFASQQFAAAAVLLKAERDNPPAGRRPREIAGRLRDRLPVLLPVGLAMETVAIRWRNQILENAEQACIVSPLPEMLHNEIMGWPWLAQQKIPAAFVVLADRQPLPEPEGSLIAFLAAQATELGFPFLLPPPPSGEGPGPLLAQVYLGDRVSLELAEERGVAATPVALIERLRACIGKERQERAVRKEP